MKPARLALVATGSPKPEPASKWAPSLSADAQRLLGAIRADTARLKVLERNPTHASVEAARVLLPGLRDLIARLERAL
jgi:hypothetical protein